jgi:hypothetical protein
MPIMASPHVEYALRNPVYNPMTQITGGHFWFHNRHIYVGLTCNIGME